MADHDTAAVAGVRSRTSVADRRHPLHVFAGRLTAALDELAGSSTPTLEVSETVDATSTAGWLRSVVRMTGPEATRDVRLAGAFAREAHQPTAAALADGRLLAGQAEVIVHAVDALPATVGRPDRHRAAERLVGLAAAHDATELRVLGRRLLEVIDPDAADAELARRLEAEEAAAASATSLTLLDDGHGSVHGRFRVPTLIGEMLRTALQALASPARPDPIPRNLADGSRRATPAVLGDAFVQYVERFPPRTSRRPVA